MDFPSFEERLKNENDRLKAALSALVKRIEETDNPSDQGISILDECVVRASALLKELE
jgi:hypothetical protein